MTKAYKLSDFLTEYSERNTENKYKPVAVGRYGIRKREEIYSKDLAKDYSKNKVIRENTLTVGMGSTQIDIGILIDDEIYSVSPAYHTYKIAGINCKYLGYYLSAKNHEMFARYVKRGSRQGKSIDLKRWLAYEMSVHDNDVQKEIVRNLGRIEAVIRQKEAELQKFDDLIKAQFVEMFGKENKTLLISDICDFCSRGRTPRYVPSSTLKVINQACIYWDGFKFENIKYNDESYSGDRILNENDILICSTGTGTLGRCNVFKRPDDNRYMADSHVTILRLNSKILPEVFKTWFERPKTQDLLYSNCVSGSTNQIELSKTKLKEMQIIVPPIQSQKQFTTFVSQVDKSKFVILCDIFSMRNLYIRLINDCITHSSINLRVP